jgi:hypothetical protein
MAKRSIFSYFSHPGRWITSALLLLAAIISGYFLWTYHGPTPPIEIYRGIVYSCERVPDSLQSGGLLHLVQADLNVPGVSLYITPLDPEALIRGKMYRLKYTSTAVRDEHLAAAVNGTLFNSDSYWIRMPGDFTVSIETVVSDHIVDHVNPNTYLLWWDDDLIAHLETNKPPSSNVLAKAKWAIGGQAPILIDGEMVLRATGVQADRRTMIAADPARRLVWIAVFDRASNRFAAQTLAAKGAKIGITVDGGTSSAMAIGPDARNVRSGTVSGNWRPVPNVFGFRAQKLPEN